MDSIKKGAKKGINEWAKEVKHNKEFAKKFEGVKNVEDILNIAKENGFSFTAKELKNCDLKSVAGGSEPGSGLGDSIRSGMFSGAGGGGVGYNTNVNTKITVDINHGSNAATATGQGSTAQANPNMNFSNNK